MRKLICVLFTSLISVATHAQPEAFPSTYEAPEGQPVLFKNATILTGDGRRLDETDLYIAEGQIQWIGQGDVAPDAIEVDANDRWITPGLIDVHSHLGVYPSPGVAAHSDGNEATAPVTAEVWAEHSVWPQDPGFSRALAGGVTAMQILPGSANLFGAAVDAKKRPSVSYQGMKFPDAPHGLKMAWGKIRNASTVVARRRPQHAWVMLRPTAAPGSARNAIRQTGIVTTKPSRTLRKLQRMTAAALRSHRRY